RSQFLHNYAMGFVRTCREERRRVPYMPIIGTEGRPLRPGRASHNLILDIQAQPSHGVSHSFQLLDRVEGLDLTYKLQLNRHFCSQNLPESNRLSRSLQSIATSNTLLLCAALLA